eukprot:4970161-Prymnesium_polylepis.1
MSRLRFCSTCSATPSLLATSHAACAAAVSTSSSEPDSSFSSASCASSRRLCDSRTCHPLGIEPTPQSKPTTLGGHSGGRKTTATA